MCSSSSGIEEAWMEGTTVARQVWKVQMAAKNLRSRWARRLFPGRISVDCQDDEVEEENK